MEELEERAEDRKMAEAEARQQGNALDADVEILQKQTMDGWDGDVGLSGEIDDDVRSVSSAPPAPNGEVDLNGWKQIDWPGGISYRGYWRENLMHGQGMLKSESGVYSGEFINHMICGTGRYDFSDGKIYVGQFVDNCFHGQGILGYDDQTVYEGDFYQGTRHGSGTIVFANGDVYEGGWNKGTRTGDDGESTIGIYVAHQGKEVYQGGFLNNYRHGDGNLWMESDGETGRGDFSKKSVVYDKGKLLKHRARPPCRPVMPERKPIAALAKARAANASWGTGAAEDFERPFSGIKSRTATPNLKKIVEDALEEEEEEDAESKGGASDAKGQDDDEDKDDDYENDAASRRDSVFSEVTDEEGGDKNMKKSLFSRVFGGCIPWLATHEADGEKEETQSYEGRPNSIVIVKIEKCVHLPAMINNETSNAYVEIKSRGKRQKTQVIKESVDPIFEEKFDMDHNTNDEVRDLLLTVYHVKFGGGKQFLGKLHIDLTHAKMGDRSRGDKSLELKGMDGITSVICKSPADGKNVNSAIFMSWSISLKPEGLMSMRLSNGRNLIPPDQNGLGTPYVKIKFDDRVLKSHTAHDMAHPRWDQIISFDTLSFDQLYILPAHAKPSPKISIELWDCRALGDDVYIGGCEYDASKIRYETRSEMEWHRISDKTRARRSNVGEIKFSMAWGPNEPTILTVQIEEGFALTTHLQSSILGKKAKSFFSQSKEEENKMTLPSPFLRFQLDNTRKRKTRVMKETTAPKWDGVNNPH